jgi:hypothetical protein
MAKPPNKPDTQAPAVVTTPLGEAFVNSGAVVMEALPPERSTAKKPETQAPAKPAQAQDPAILAMGQQVIAQAVNQPPIADAPQAESIKFGPLEIIQAFLTNHNIPYARPDSIYSRVVGGTDTINETFGTHARPRVIGSATLSKLDIPVTENLIFRDPVEGKDRISSEFGMRMD